MSDVKEDTFLKIKNKAHKCLCIDGLSPEFIVVTHEVNKS